MSRKFLTALHSDRILLMDGAMGTELQRAGLPEGACAAPWNLEHPERVLQVHQRYVAAGAQALLTNTFQCHGDALAALGKRSSTEAVVAEGVRLAEQARPEGGF